MPDLPLWLENREENYWYERIDGSGAMFFQFNIPRNSRRPWREFLDEMFQYIRNDDEIDRLIIDLRHNEGGWAYMAHELVHEIVGVIIPGHPGHRFRRIADSDSDGCRTPIPMHRGHHSEASRTPGGRGVERG